MCPSCDFFQIDEDCPLPKCSIILLILLILSFFLLLFFLFYIKRKFLFQKFRIHPFQKKPFSISPQKDENKGGKGSKGGWWKKGEDRNRSNYKKTKKTLKTERIQKPINQLLIEGVKKEKGKKARWSEVDNGEKSEKVMNLTSISEYLHNNESLKNKMMEFEEVESFETIYAVKEGEIARKEEKRKSISIFSINKRKISEDQYFFIQKKLKLEAILKNKPRRSVSLDSNQRNMLLDQIEEKSKNNINEKEKQSYQNREKIQKNKFGLEEKMEENKKNQQAEEGKVKKNMDNDMNLLSEKQKNIKNMVWWDFNNVTLEIEKV